MNENILLIEGIFALREWCKLNLPTEDSLVAYDILLIIAISHYTNSPITVKHLFSSMPHSYTAIRHHYKRFISDGWIEHDTNEKDRRIKIVKGTSKLIETLNNYVATATNIFASNKSQWDGLERRLAKSDNLI